MFPPCYLTRGQTMVEVMKIMITSFKKIMITSSKKFHACTAKLSAPNPAAGHCGPTPPPETPRHSQASLAQSLMGTLFFLWGPGVHKVLFVPSKSLFPQPCGSSVIKFHWPPKSNSLGVLSRFARSPVKGRARSGLLRHARAC